SIVFTNHDETSTKPQRHDGTTKFQFQTSSCRRVVVVKNHLFGMTGAGSIVALRTRIVITCEPSTFCVLPRTPMYSLMRLEMTTSASGSTYASTRLVAGLTRTYLSVTTVDRWRMPWAM